MERAGLSIGPQVLISTKEFLMVATSLQSFECLHTFNNSASFTKETCDYLAERAEAVLKIFQTNPQCADLPYGYDVETKTGWLYKSAWPRLNVLAAGMEFIGFSEHRHQITEQLSGWHAIASQVWPKTGVLEEDAVAWGWANVQSELALFIVHVMNIYRSEDALLTNLYRVNLREDALGRKNYQPTIEAFAKVVRKNLGWKGECFGKPQDRAMLLVSLVERNLSLRNRVTAHNGLDYERACEAALVTNGFAVESTPITGDYGADLIAEKDDIRFAIQCKDLSRPVGIKGIQEAIGARRHYQADFSCVCCDCGFTDAAIELATSNKVVLAALTNLASQLEYAR